MAEIRLPLIPLGPFNILFQYGQGRLHAPAPDAQTLIIAMPPDGVFLQTLRVRGFLQDASWFDIIFYRTAKLVVGGPSPLDPIVKETRITVPAGGAVFDQSFPLAPSGKNVVDNSIYNYTFYARAGSTRTDPDLKLIIGDVSLLY